MSFVITSCYRLSTLMARKSEKKRFLDSQVALIAGSNMVEDSFHKKGGLGVSFIGYTERLLAGHSESVLTVHLDQHSAK